MPSMRLILTVAVVSAATYFGIQHYQKVKGG